MTVRGWVGLTAAAVMLHTNVKVAFTACVLPESGAMTAHVSPAHSASNRDRTPEGDHGPTHHHEQTPAPEETASPPGERGGSSDGSMGENGCQQMNSCGGLLILNQSVVRTATGLAATAAIPGRSEALFGRAAEPEPPPPKA